MNHDTDRRAEMASLYTLLSECLKHPNETFYDDVASGRFDDERETLTLACDIEPETVPTADQLPDSRAALDNEYISLFEAFETPYAPPVESPYKAWHKGAGSDGLLGGPPADDMRRRYASLDASPPAAYQPDHLALLLEYASMLVESDDRDAYVRFLEDHLDWLPAFGQLVAEAAADAPFYRHSVVLVCDTVAVERERLDVSDPEPGTIETMVARARGGMDGMDDEKAFRE